jgi:ankyrin repeat protein
MVEILKNRKLYKLIVLAFVCLFIGETAMAFYSADNRAGMYFGHTKITSVFKDKKERKLVLAAAGGDVDKIDALVKEGVNVNAVRRGGMTPLLWLAGQNPINLKGFKALLKHGADPNYIPPKGAELYGLSVIYTLAGIIKINENRHVAGALDLALKYGGNPNIINPEEEDALEQWQTALICAAKEGQSENMEVLLKHGAEIDKRDETGMTALLWAASNNQYEAAYFLLKHGANYRISAYIPGSEMNPKLQDKWNKPVKIDLSSIIALSLYAGLSDDEIPWRTKVIKWLEAHGVPKPKPRAY